MVSRALREAGLHEVLVHTGQHFEDNMSEVFFSELDLPATGLQSRRERRCAWRHDRSHARGHRGAAA